MQTVTSQDGTRIAFDQAGSGPAIIFVDGALVTRSNAAPYAALLAPHFTVINYDRRGRGDSSDTQPYAVEREIEDLQALIQHAGGSANLVGTSSGAVLALRAAAHGLNVNKLALYEPPFAVDNARPPVPADYTPHLKMLAEQGQRGDAVEYFLTQAALVPAAAVAQMRHAPMWSGMEATAPTIWYDGSVMGDTMRGSPEPLKQWSSMHVPTLVMDGGASPDWMHHAAQALVAVLPNAQYRTLAGQTHAVEPQALAPVLKEFFKS